jgi:hypothetical protein
MFDIRKIQEQILFGAINAASNDETATKIVYGENRLFSSGDNATWVKSTMNRAENHFDMSKEIY